MKHILIDARLYGPKHTGIGRYTKNLLIALVNNPDFKKYKFTLIIYKDLETEIKKDLSNHYNYITTNIHHYSLKEQLILPFVIYWQKPDLVHFTHFNKPILYFGNSIVTIHDLIKHFFKGKETTTHNTFLYWIKYFMYLALVNLTVKTNNLIVPSNFWRNYLIEKFKINSKKITTTYEAVDLNFISSTDIIEKPKNYIVYTGNLYPHKNIDVILKSLKLLPDIKLKIICARSYFSQKLKTKIKKNKLAKQVEFLGYVPDKKFVDIYKNAIALVHPSFMEGFSLTGLEAMALNCPVISSNSSCLPEIYGNSVLYFDPLKADELIERINKLLASSKLRQKLISLGKKQLSKYSWMKTADITMQVYQQNL